jgi:hypothetical protein
MSSKIDPLYPVHRSVKATPRGRIVPRDMTTYSLSDGELEALTNIALSIFTDCVNCGITFQDAILAVYASGLQHGQALTQERIKE